MSVDFVARVDLDRQDGFVDLYLNDSVVDSFVRDVTFVFLGYLNFRIGGWDIYCSYMDGRLLEETKLFVEKKRDRYRVNIGLLGECWFDASYFGLGTLGAGWLVYGGVLWLRFDDSFMHFLGIEFPWHTVWYNGTIVYCDFSGVTFFSDGFLDELLRAAMIDSSMVYFGDSLLRACLEYIDRTGRWYKGFLSLYSHAKGEGLLGGEMSFEGVSSPKLLKWLSDEGLIS